MSKPSLYVVLALAASAFLLVARVVFPVTSARVAWDAAHRSVASRLASRIVTGPTPAESPNLALGAPVGSDAATFVLRPEYALSYSRSRRGANWVAWRLEAVDLGRAPRSHEFLPAPFLPASEQIVSSDYEGTGFDRGHLVPAADRAGTAEAIRATFFLDNALPQQRALNRGPWEALEKYMRRLAKTGLRIFIVAGPLWGESTATLGEHRVPVPAAFWKVGVVVCGSCGPEAVDATTPTIAVVMPNEESVGRRWMTYQTTIAEVETRSGYQLLGRVPETVRAALRIRLDRVGQGR